MSDTSLSAEGRLSQLIDRLISTANGAAAAADWQQVRAVAEDILTVDPDNAEAGALLERARRSATAPAGQRALMTLLFSDLVDSTPLADGAEPEVVRDVFQVYREVATASINKYGGKILNYMGDGIVAAFGFPTSHEDDARRAVLAGLDLVSRMERVTDGAGAQRVKDIDAQVRVGIHTGQVVISDIGVGVAIERDAIVGIAPNMAARIQGEAEPAQVLISDVTYGLVEGEFATTSLGVRDLRGISRPVELFTADMHHAIDERLDAARFRRNEVVGRTDIRDQLASGWDQAVADASPMPTLLLGGAGFGKSRLAAEARYNAITSGAQVFDFGCLPYYTNSPLWPVTETLKRSIGILSTTPNDERVELITSFLDNIGVPHDVGVPQLASMLGFDPGPDFPAPPIDPVAARQNLLTTLVTWIQSNSEQPRFVLFEDLHWADASTNDLAGMLIADQTHGTQVVMTSRSEINAPWGELVQAHKLEALPPADAKTFVSQMLADSPLNPPPTDATVNSIVRRADGIPLFLEELTRAAIASPGTEVFPMRLQELLTARLKEPTVDLVVAQVAATLGPAFDLSTLEAISDSDANTVDGLQGLVSANIVEPDASSSNRYRFCHALLRDAAYETQVLDRRRAVHRRAADQLLAKAADPVVIAHHFDMAGDAVEATQHYLMASMAAHQRGANEEAQQLASKGINLTSQLPEGIERDMIELQLRMLRTLSASSVYGYGVPSVEADLRRSMAISESHRSIPDLLPTTIGLWSWMFVTGRLASAAQLTYNMRAAIDDGIGAAFDAEVGSCEGYQALYEGRLDEAHERFLWARACFARRPADEAVSPFWPLPNDPIAINEVGLALTYTLRGDFAAADEAQANAVTRAGAEPFREARSAHVSSRCTSHGSVRRLATRKAPANTAPESWRSALSTGTSTGSPSVRSGRTPETLTISKAASNSSHKSDIERS